jgi:hypothetical protein
VLPQGRLQTGYPEDVEVWYYIDPSGLEQGPYTIQRLRTWADALHQQEPEGYPSFMKSKTFRKDMEKRLVLGDLLAGNVHQPSNMAAMPPGFSRQTAAAAAAAAAAGGGGAAGKHRGGDDGPPPLVPVAGAVANGEGGRSGGRSYGRRGSDDGRSRRR